MTPYAAESAKMVVLECDRRRRRNAVTIKTLASMQRARSSFREDDACPGGANFGTFGSGTVVGLTCPSVVADLCALRSW